MGRMWPHHIVLPLPTAPETESTEGPAVDNVVKIIKDINILPLLSIIAVNSHWYIFLFPNVFIVDCGCLSLIFPSES